MITKILLSILRQIIFWTLLFIAQRLIFILYYHKSILNLRIDLSEVLLTFIYALKLDFSAVSYILILPILLSVFFVGSYSKLIHKVIRIYSQILILLILLINAGEIGIYKEWESKLSVKALVYLMNPSEVLASAKTWDLIQYTLLVGVQFLLFRFLYNQFVIQKVSIEVQWPKILFTLFPILALLIIGIRGGIGQIPISISDGYFSKHMILNHAAVNPAYNLMFSVVNYSNLESYDKFEVLPKEEAKHIVDSIHHEEADTNLSILNIDRPNVLILFLESWSGDLIESLGGKPGITPEFHKIEKEGLLFTNFYASGNRSQQALASVFSGLPSIPFTTLTSHQEKYGSIRSMVRMLNQEGYFSSFYFGGDLNYGNIRSYLIHNQFSKIIDENEFAGGLEKGKLGYHDEFLFDKLKAELASQPKPFFTAALTLSSHSPYDQPGERPIDNIDKEKEYVNSAWYTDKCLGAFFEKIKKESWYDSTVIFVMSDHSHPSYNGYPVWTFKYRNIPLLILGGALKQEFRGVINDKIASNSDITSTLLNQLSMDTGDFYWSKDIFNPKMPGFAYFQTDYSYGFKSSEGCIEYHFNASETLLYESDSVPHQTFKKVSDAYLQVLFQDFLAY